MKYICYQPVNGVFKYTRFVNGVSAGGGESSNFPKNVPGYGHSNKAQFKTGERIIRYTQDDSSNVDDQPSGDDFDLIFHIQEEGKDEELISKLEKLSQAELDIELSLPGAEGGPAEKELVIHLDNAGKISLNGETVDLPVLKMRLDRHIKECSKKEIIPMVLLESAGEADKKALFNLINVVRNSGIDNIAFRVK